MMGNTSVRFSFGLKATPQEAQEDTAVSAVLKTFMSRICRETLIYGNVCWSGGWRGENVD